MGMYYQGKYKPNHPDKYRGDVGNIVFRSSWEAGAFAFCDNTPQIVQWNSEETVVPYISPIDGRLHRYFVDLTIWCRQADGSVKVSLVEIKPFDQTQPPVSKSGKRKDRFLNECATFKVNEAKWDAARALCNQKGWNFVIWTEKELLPHINDSVNRLKSQRTYEDKMKKAFKKKVDPRVKIMAIGLKRNLKEKIIGKG